MHDYATEARKTASTAEVPTENERVTARIVREGDGTTHHQYSVGGRVYESLTELRAALGDRR